MMPTVGTIVACVVGGAAVLVVSAAIITDKINDYRYRINRMTEPGEWPEEFMLNANDCHREGVPKAW